MSSMEQNTLLSVEDLSVSYKVYGGFTDVLNKVSFNIGVGKRVGLVGETGCGKTTSLKTIMGILSGNAVAKGRIMYGGSDLLQMKKSKFEDIRKRDLSMIFQNPSSSLNPVFTIGSQLYDAIGASLDRQSRNSKLIKELAVKALSDVSLADPERILGSYPFQLSGGMRQRVCIAMTIATERKVILADEPGTALDVTVQDQILRLISNLVTAKNFSLLLVSHSLGIIREMTDWIYVMYGGTIVESGKTELILAEPRHPYTAALMECVPKLSGEGISRGINGDIVDYKNPPKGCRFYPRCPKAMDVCREHVPAVKTSIDKEHSIACHFYN